MPLRFQAGTEAWWVEGGGGGEETRDQGLHACLASGVDEREWICSWHYAEAQRGA